MMKLSGNRIALGDICKLDMPSNFSTREFLGKNYDNIFVIVVNGSELKITKRLLDNNDFFLFFEIKKPTNIQIEFMVGSIENKESFDHLYQKPNFDQRYGNNKLTGINSYLDLQIGSAVLSKIYSYNLLETRYSKEESSQVFELVQEMNEIEIKHDGEIRVSINSNEKNVSFFLLYSHDKLFHDKRNLLKYMRHHYESVYNNAVWCSYFTLPSGTYTKLPYSIEPYTVDGYGFSLHHSSKKEMFSWFKETKERFFFDFLTNAVLQAFIYQKTKNGVFLTPYTSTWLKKDTGITAPYIDTRLNETFILMLEDFLPYSLFGGRLDPLRDYMDFLYKIYLEDQQTYRLGKGIFFADYFSTKQSKISHSSLNHQLGVALLFKRAYLQYNDEKYLQVFQGIINFIEETAEQWINPESSDLFYGVKKNLDGSFLFFDKDYVYVTLSDLLLTQKSFMELHQGQKNPTIEQLTKKKTQYLSNTKFNVFSENASKAPGESINSQNNVQKLIQEIYGEIKF